MKRLILILLSILIMPLAHADDIKLISKKVPVITAPVTELPKKIDTSKVWDKCKRQMKIADNGG